MRAVLVGSGAREHALAHQLAASKHCEELIVLPGNPGIALLEKVRCAPVPGDDLQQLTAQIAALKPDFVVIGPEGPLVAGISDQLAALHLPTVGPSARAARIEGSKAFAKSLMAQAGVQTAQALMVTQDTLSLGIQAIKNTLRETDAPAVIKADGLAAGKGVLVTSDVNQASAFLQQCVAQGTALIETFLPGQELSFFALCAGEAAVPLGMARDYKRAYDHNLGPNTGGMGAVCLNRDPMHLTQTIMEQIVTPTLRALTAQDCPFFGFLFIGLMRDAMGKPAVVEFNARLGEPETQALLQTIDSDLFLMCAQLAQGQLPTVTCNQLQSVAITLASQGYPHAPQRGTDLFLPRPEQLPDHVTIYHAGTTQDSEHRLKINGGRVASVTASAPTIAEATKNAYKVVHDICDDSRNRDNLFFRSDIGYDVNSDSYFAETTS